MAAVLGAKRWRDLEGMLLFISLQLHQCPSTHFGCPQSPSTARVAWQEVCAWQPEQLLLIFPRSTLSRRAKLFVVADRATAKGKGETFPGQAAYRSPPHQHVIE